MYTCIYVMYICTCIYMYLHVFTCIYMYFHEFTWMYIYIYILICIYVFMYTYICIHVHMYEYVSTYIHICLYIYIYVYTHMPQLLRLFLSFWKSLHHLNRFGFWILVFMCMCQQVKRCPHREHIAVCCSVAELSNHSNPFLEYFLLSFFDLWFLVSCGWVRVAGCWEELVLFAGISASYFLFETHSSWIHEWVRDPFESSSWVKDLVLDWVVEWKI